MYAPLMQLYPDKLATQVTNKTVLDAVAKAVSYDRFRLLED